ncbi:MAG: CCXG family PEP-CTERM protein [Myxococcota bacterium]
MMSRIVRSSSAVCVRPFPRPAARGGLRFAGALAALATVLIAGQAAALSFRADFRSSTYQTQAGDSFADLLLEHQAGSLIQSTVTTGLANISTAVYANGVTSDYSILMTTTFQVAVAGSYTFQVGTDWGRGGAAALIDATSGTVLSERVITDDVWWNNSWTNPDVFTTTATFAVGDSVTLAWVGFEGCCGGSSTIRFSVDGSGYQNFTETNFDGFTVVPEPSTGFLFGIGLLGLSWAGRRSTRT